MYKLLLVFALMGFSLSHLLSQNLTIEDERELLALNNLKQNYKTAGNQNQTAHILYKIGVFYWQHSDNQNAIEHFNQAIDIYRLIRNENAQQMIYSNLGQIYFDLSKLDIAKSNFEKSLAIARKTKNSDNIASQLLNISLVLSKENKYVEANLLLTEAAEIANLRTNVRQLRAIFSSMAENYQKIGDQQKSIEYYNFFLSLDRMIRDEEMRKIKVESEAEIAKANAEKKQKELDLALQRFKTKATEDSLKEVEKSIHDKQLQLELLKKEQEVKELALAREEGNRKMNLFIIYGIIGLLVIVVMFAILVLIQMKKTKSSKLKVEEYLLEIEAKKIAIEAQAEILDQQNKQLEKLSIVASNTDNVVIIINEIGEIEWVNDAFQRLWGFTIEEYVQIFGSNFFETSGNENVLTAFRQSIEGKKSMVYTSRQFNKFGQEIWTQTTLNPIFNEDGRLSKMIALDSNITEIKKVEQKITDSINYASRIQKGLLPDSEHIASILPEHFILFKPRDVVSGDFYWFLSKNKKIYIAAADCTGHGVPGALMSILGISLLTEIVKNNDFDAATILNELRIRIKTFLSQKTGEDERREGMDIAFCIMDKETDYINYAGAYNPLYILRNNEIIEFKADKMPVGAYRIENDFSNNQIKIQTGDLIYLFTDGITDQFGGSRNDKLKSSRFKNVLLEIYPNKLHEQKQLLNNFFETWKGNNMQMDDVLIVGFKIV